MKLITVLVKVGYEDDKGRLKSRKETYLVNARDFTHAIEIIKEEFNGLTENWEIVRISPSSVISILNYDGGHKITGREVSSTIPEIKLT